MKSPTAQTAIMIFLTTCAQLVNALTTNISPKGTAAATTTTLDEIIHNLNVIVSHIQNPELYSPSWANQMTFLHGDNNNDEIKIPIAKCDIHPGELITLFPIQSISIIGQHQDIMEDDNNNTEEMKKKSQLFGSSSTTESIIVSKRVDLLEEKRYPYPYLRAAAPGSIYIHADKDVILDGWYGHIIPSITINKESCDAASARSRSNCRFVPLPSVAPLCGMVATRSIVKGEEIISADDGIPECPEEAGSLLQDETEEELYRFTNDIAKKYANELGELLSYLQMAYNTAVPTATKEEEENTSIITVKKKKKQKYHSINQGYPNLQKIHSSPDIYAVENFLSQDECERVISKARLNIQPCLVKNEDTGAVEVDPSRTSTNANIPRREVPSITNKILQLLGNCVEEQLETFQVLNYKRGQEFKAHTDGFDRPTTACGFQDSGRIATMFCYLNDVPSGGTTMFTKLGLDIEPKRGMAVVHFPMSLDLVEDVMTEHQGSVAMDEKWILTTWIWKHWMADYRYSEENIEALSDDVI